MEELLMFSNDQKKLILRVLSKEKKKLFSRNKGKLLDKTISDLSQMVLNEERNNIKSFDSSIDWSTRKKR